MSDEVPAAAAELYGLPPERFTAERNQLAKALAAKGDPDAERVRKLARPDRLAHALNVLARVRKGGVEALLEAGARLRRGQRRALSGGGPEELRAAERAVREAARTLREAAPAALAEAGAKPLAPPMLAELELALRVAATGTEDERDALRRGVLARAPERSGFGELAGLAVVPGVAPHAEERGKEIPSPPAPSKERVQSARRKRREPSAAARERRAAERAAAAEREALARAEARARERAAAKARKDLATAEAVLRRRTEEFEAAERRAAEARERVSRAEREVEEARKRVEEIGLQG